MTITLNGQPQTLSLGDLGGETPKLAHFIASLGLAGDRVAVEQNGNIVPRAIWPTTCINEGDRFEIVHFVGGGSRFVGGGSKRVCGGARPSRPT